MYFSILTFVHLSREVDAVHTHTHTYTRKHPQANSFMCATDAAYLNRNTDPTSAFSFIYIAYFCVCMLSLLCCPVSSFHVVFAVGSSSTTGCRSSSRSRCLLLCSRSQNKEEMDGQEGGRGGGLGVVQEGQKQGKKEKPKREKTKIYCHWLLSHTGVSASRNADGSEGVDADDGGMN